MNSNRIMAAPELAAELGVTEIDLQRIAHERRLPFAFSPTLGFFIQRRDAASWRAAMEPKTGCCEGA
jgi:hypothetical protein